MNNEQEHLYSSEVQTIIGLTQKPGFWTKTLDNRPFYPDSKPGF